MATRMNLGANVQKANEMRKRATTAEYKAYESPFYATRTRFRSAVGCEPWSYEDWLGLDDELKAAALYVTFFDQVTLAWAKAKSAYYPDEEGVSTLMQYLMKNVTIIINEPKKYTPAYIYRVAYNCLDCAARFIKRDKDAYENNVSQYTFVGDDMLDLFDIIADNIAIEDDVHENVKSRDFWDYIQNSGIFDEDEISVIDNLLTGDPMIKSARHRKRKIMEGLKDKLIGYKDLYLNDADKDNSHIFAYVLKHDDNIASAVVKLPTGEKVVYYGDKHKDAKGHLIIEFFGAESDYEYPVEVARAFAVIDIETY